jgi:hypothetical protein
MLFCFMARGSMCKGPKGQTRLITIVPLWHLLLTVKIQHATFLCVVIFFIEMQHQMLLIFVGGGASASVITRRNMPYGRHTVNIQHIGSSSHMFPVTAKH